MIAVSRGGLLLWGTSALRRLLGWSPEEVRGRSATYPAPDPATSEQVGHEIERIQSGEVARLLAPILDAQGHEYLGRWELRRKRGRIFHYCLALWRRCHDCDGTRCGDCQRRSNHGQEVG